MTTNYRRCFYFLNACYHNSDFRVKDECNDILDAMKRHKNVYGFINEAMALDLDGMIERGKKLLNHPEDLASEPKLCFVLEDMKRAFAV